MSNQTTSTWPFWAAIHIGVTPVPNVDSLKSALALRSIWTISLCHLSGNNHWCYSIADSAFVAIRPRLCQQSNKFNVVILRRTKIGVTPVSVLALLLSARASISNRTTLTWPFWTATCIGVAPVSVLALLLSALALIRNWRSSTLPLFAAQKIGVTSSVISGLMSAFASMSNRTTSTWRCRAASIDSDSSTDISLIRSMRPTVLIQAWHFELPHASEILPYQFWLC